MEPTRKHFAYFTGQQFRLNEAPETLCGELGRYCSDIAAVTCPNCRVCLDAAMEAGQLDEVVPGIFWVVVGDAPKRFTDRPAPPRPEPQLKGLEALLPDQFVRGVRVAQLQNILNDPNASGRQKRRARKTLNAYYRGDYR